MINEKMLNLTSRGTPLPEFVTEEVLKESGLTQAGAAAIEAALDPFHDYNIANLRGWVDSFAGDTITQVFTRQYQITTSEAFGDSLWDAQIILTNSDIAELFVCTSTPTGVGSDNIRNSTLTPPLGVQFGAASEIQVYGAVTVCKNVHNSSVSPFVKVGDQETVVIEPFASTEVTDADVAVISRPTGAYRVIGAAFEIHDDTAELYKQGGSTFWRWPDYEESESLYYVKNITISGSTPSTTTGTSIHTMQRKPPQNSTEARLFPRSKTGLARDGAYVVGTMRNSILPMSRISDARQLYCNEDLSTMGPGTTEADSESIWISDPSYYTTASAGSSTDPRILSLSHPHHDSGLNPGGVVFSGLSSQASLRLVVKYIIEQAPNGLDAQLIPLVTPSAAFDSRALELYGRLVNTVPVGTSVFNNASGDYWKGIIGNIVKGAKIGRRVLREASEVPMLASLVGPIESAVSAAELAYNVARKQKKKQKALNPMQMQVAALRQMGKQKASNAKKK
jgi:hypothetical protein